MDRIPALKIVCRHGFFIIRDEGTWEIPRFNQIFGLNLVSYLDYFTFPKLSSPPGYSIIGKPTFGLPAIKAYEGEPWEIMRQNKIVYDFNAGLIKPIISVTEKLFLRDAGQFYISNGLIVPGSFKDDGTRVTDYSARFIWDSMSFRYSEVVSE